MARCAEVGGPSRCAYFDANLNGGAMSFDNMAYSFIVIFQAGRTHAAGWAVGRARPATAGLMEGIATLHV